jgi:DNA-binding CsgD family transcriptional regulator
MENTTKLYYDEKDLVVTKDKSANSKTSKTSTLLKIIEEKDQKIAELERLLDRRTEKLWKFKFLNERIKKLAFNDQYQDLLPDQLPQLSRILNQIEKNIVNADEPVQRYMGRLKTAFPNLSSNDLRICSLLRQNLSTKEVAQQLGIGADSANKARYRIRKKLKLSREDGLIQFLLHF